MSPSSPSPSPQSIDPDDAANLAHWRDEFGVTQEQLQEAVLAVGNKPADVREHFLRQGSSAGAS